MSEDFFRFLMMEAEETPLGIAITTNEPQLLRNKLYALRRESPGCFTSLSFVIPPVPGELWIVKKETANGEA